MLQAVEKENFIKKKNELTDIFFSGCKNIKTIGIELEKLAVYKKSLEAVKYHDIKNLLLKFDSKKWDKYIENGQFLGLKSSIGAITLEPGSQVEISFNPQKDLHDINKNILNYCDYLKGITKNSQINFLSLGIQPVSTYNEINIIPKERYRKMTDYLPQKGSMPFVMMRETAGVQVSLDYKNENDAMRKFSLALKLSPIISAFYANSPFRNARLTEYKSFRLKSWLDTDNERCGLVSRKLFENPLDFSFEDYAEILLDVPMIFIERNNRTFEVKNLTFRKFLNNGWQGLYPVIEDWYNHLSLYFPDVRLKNYIEIRNHDSQKNNLISSVPALWKGLLYNDDAIAKTEKLLENLTFEDFNEIRNNTPFYGMEYTIKNIKIADLIKEIFYTASNSLSLEGNNEHVYLQPAIELLNKNKTPADILIEKWNNEWEQNINKMKASKYIFTD